MSRDEIPAAPREFLPHDHAHCVSDALSAAERVCALAGARMTPVRRRALEILLEGHRPMGAYDVLARLDEDGFGSKPPVAYRALGFLVENGLAHRIERLNAFVACLHADGASHAAAFLICRHCLAVAEVPASLGALPESFRVEKTTVEVEGLCGACAEIAG